METGIGNECHYICAENQARAVAYILTRNAHLSTRIIRRWTGRRASSLLKLGESKNKAKYTQVYADELVVSGL